MTNKDLRRGDVAAIIDHTLLKPEATTADVAAACPKIRQLSIGSLLAETIRRVSAEESVSSLYVD